MWLTFLEFQEIFRERKQEREVNLHRVEAQFSRLIFDLNVPPPLIYYNERLFPGKASLMTINTLVNTVASPDFANTDTVSRIFDKFLLVWCCRSAVSSVI